MATHIEIITLDCNVVLTFACPYTDAGTTCPKVAHCRAHREQRGMSRPPSPRKCVLSDFTDNTLHDTARNAGIQQCYHMREASYSCLDNLLGIRDEDRTPLPLLVALLKSFTPLTSYYSRGNCRSVFASYLTFCTITQVRQLFMTHE